MSAANESELNCTDATLNEQYYLVYDNEEVSHVERASLLCSINLSVWNYVAPFYLIGGIVLNVLGVVIWLRPVLRQQAGDMTKSIVLLACCDILSLYSGFLRHFARKNSFVHWDAQLSSAFICKSTEFMLYFSLSLSAWLIALIAVERCCLIVCPLSAARHRILDNCVTSRGALVALVAICAGFNAHIFWTRILTVEQTRKLCINTHDPEWQYFLRNVWPLADLAFTTVLPNLTTCAASVAIIARLNYTRAPAAAHLPDRAPSNARHHSFVAKHSRRITVTLLCIVAFYVLCQLPAKLWLITKPTSTLKVNHAQDYFAERLAWTVILLVEYASNVLNFCVYSLSNRHFRKELEICCSLKKHASA